MTKMRYRGVLFDMDGVILDTEPHFAEAFVEAAAKRGYPDTEELHLNIMGISQAESLIYCKKQMGQDFPYTEIAEETFRIVRRQVMDGRVPYKKGWLECVNGLKERQIKIALVTSTPREVVEEYFQYRPELQSAFDAILCGGEVAHSKPAPDMYLEAARRLGIPPGECVGVEDSGAGVHSVSSAGCLSVMIPDLLSYDEKVAGAVDVCLYDLTRLCPLLDKLNQ